MEYFLEQFFFSNYVLICVLMFKNLVFLFLFLISLFLKKKEKIKKNVFLQEFEPTILKENGNKIELHELNQNVSIV